MTPAERERVLASFYTRERHSGASPLEANERMHDFSKRLDAAEQNKRVADDAFSRDLEIIRQCMEHTR